MSVTSQLGLAGVSIQTTRVWPGRIAAATARKSVMSTSSTATPQGCSSSSSHLRSAQYISLGATTWSPGLRAWNTLVNAAVPEANSSAPAPPSIEARTASAVSTVGLSGRL